VKKGQFLSPAEMANVVEKLRQGAPTSRDRKGAVLAGSKYARRGKANTPLPHGDGSSGIGKVILTERGTFFGYNRLVNDFVGLADMMDLGCPVCFDATHSTQQPGGQGAQSGGRPQRAAVLARCAVAAGVHAIFLETHPDPAHAKSDAASMLQLDAALALLDDLACLHAAVANLRSHRCE
jgi:2-dehydro-3-deoxyphosphooctonate aldolase (KDO 8-P synthase)